MWLDFPGACYTPLGASCLERSTLSADRPLRITSLLPLAEWYAGQAFWSRTIQVEENSVSTITELTWDQTYWVPKSATNAADLLRRHFFC
jgi:hypothetical protein